MPCSVLRHGRGNDAIRCFEIYMTYICFTIKLPKLYFTEIINVFDYRGRTQLPNAKMSEAPVTLGLRPGYDLPATEKWANRRKNVRLVADVVRLVAEIVGDRKGQISRSKVVVMFKIQSHRCHGLSVYPVCVCNRSG